MPIVDGLTSTKMIRSFEKSHPSGILSEHASANGRVPVIAVSASLIEKERQVYIDAGFDGWILKPISFLRLSEIMEAIKDQQVRQENLYQPGSWERGGWFHKGHSSPLQADTRPTEEPPQKAPGVDAPEGIKVAAAVDDPTVREEATSEQTEEQNRLIEEQEKKQDEEDPVTAAPQTNAEQS